MSTLLDIHKSKNALKNFFKKDGFVYWAGNKYKYLTGSSNFISKLKSHKKYVLTLAVLTGEAQPTFAPMGFGEAKAVRGFNVFVM